MKIIGTKKIRGSLQVSKPMMEIKSGKEYIISSSQYNSSEIQNLLALRYIEKVGKEEAIPAGTPASELINLTPKIIKLMSIDKEVPAGGSLLVEKTRLDGMDIKFAIENGLLTSVDAEIFKDGQTSASLARGVHDKEAPAPQEDAAPEEISALEEVLPEAPLPEPTPEPIPETNILEDLNPVVIEQPESEPEADDVKNFENAYVVTTETDNSSDPTSNSGARVVKQVTPRRRSPKSTTTGRKQPKSIMPLPENPTTPEE